MSLSIRTNVASLVAQNNLSQTQDALQTSMARLSSGMRITKASDDAAGLGISVNLEAQIASYNQASHNANDGISVTQTAEGALNEVTNILSRLRELAMQASSSGVSDTTPITTEANQLASELDRIGATTEYNGTKLLNGSAATLTFQIGIRSSTNDHISIDMSNMKANSSDLGLGAMSLATASSATTALGLIDTALSTVSQDRGTLGAYANRFQSVINTIQSASQNLSAADSRIRDVDVAAETAALSRTQVLSQAGISVLAQANQMPQMALKLLG